MNQISLTVPSDDKKALVAGATMLLTLAGKIPEMELDEGPTIQEEVRAALEKVASTDPEPTAPAATDGEPGDDPSDDPTTEEEETTASTLDAEGLPWDPRIHSGGKTKLGDGTWRKKKGVDQADYDRVVAELQQLMAAPVVPPPPAAAAEVPPPPPAAEDDAVPPPPPAVAATEVPASFPEFLHAITQKVQAEELTIARVNEALGPHGIASLDLLGRRPDLIPQIWADLVAPA